VFGEDQDGDLCHAMVWRLWFGGLESRPRRSRTRRWPRDVAARVLDEITTDRPAALHHELAATSLLEAARAKA
jgi:hypothetical protein